MSDEIAIAKTVSIREAGYDEFWLQDQICKNPTILNLGDLQRVDRERRQPHGGRLDILLRDTDEGTMYEVEVMLGETDETHIVRTLEYSFSESRRHPQYNHVAVLVAERVNRRFFDVIYNLSAKIPIIAIQATIVEVAANKALHFATILDTYQEPDDSFANRTYSTPDEGYWTDKAPAMLETAKTLIEILKPVFPTAEYILKKSRIRVQLDGQYYATFWPRRGNMSKLYFWFSVKVPPQAIQQLDKAKITYKKSKDGAEEPSVMILTDTKLIRTHARVMLKLAAIAKQSWQK